ncbi:hypothetical protein [Cellulomonas hominis]
MAPRLHPVVGGTALVAVGTAVALASTPGTYALWGQSAAIPDQIITAGGMELAITAGTQPAPQGQVGIAIPAATWATMLPGDVIGAPITLTNWGAAPASISARVDPGTAGTSCVDVRLAQGGCPVDTPAGTVLAAAPSAPVGPVLGVAGSAQYCLQVALSPTIPATRQGTQIVPAFTVTVTGAQEGSS